MGKACSEPPPRCGATVLCRLQSAMGSERKGASADALPRWLAPGRGDNAEGAPVLWAWRPLSCPWSIWHDRGLGGRSESA